MVCAAPIMTDSRVKQYALMYFSSALHNISLKTEDSFYKSWSYPNHGCCFSFLACLFHMYK